MIARLSRNILTAEAIGLILIAIALRTFTFGIAASLRNTDTQYFFWVCLVAALISFGLSKLKLSGVQVLAGLAVVGILGIWILGAGLALPLFGLGNVILSLIPQIIPSMRSHTPIDTTELAEAWLVITQASSALTALVFTWLVSLKNHATVNDALVRNMIWTFIVWLWAAWLGWSAGRRNAIAALLPSILLLALITDYSENRIETLWLMVFVLLLLMGVWNYKNHTKQWEKRKVDYSDSIRYDVSQAVILLAVVISLIAFITPSVSWRQIRDFLREWNQPSKNEVADLLGVQRKPPAPSQNISVQQPSLPRDHLLTGGFAHSQQVVMTISTGELPPIPNIEFASSAPRYYWRSVTYDIYAGSGWISSAAPSQKVQANTPLIQGLLHGYKALHLDVQMAEPEGKLFWSGMLFSVDSPFTADWRIRPQSNLFADQSALLQADMFAAVSDVRSYKAESYLPLVTVDQMRAAPTDYPEEITKHYLGLPASVPERVRQLAREITKGKTNTYDKAKAIEAYLRGYPYDLEIPAPPKDQDVADYFLFNLRRGYCDYYATAMVVLARANGIPARFVSGYAPGSYDAPNARYVVRELDAHSWAEVYFPEIGWVEFEPTAAQPEIIRYQSESTASPTPDPEAIQLLKRFKFGQLIDWLLPVAVILVLFLLQFTVIERWRYLRLDPAMAIEKIYRRLYKLGRPLAGELTKAETAYEFMQKLVDKIELTREGSYFTRLLLSAQQDIELLTDLYQATLFSHNNIQKRDARKAFNTWKHLRLRLLIARLNVILRSRIAATKNLLRNRRNTLPLHGSE
ncbi:MAG TPA: transglutaminase-like domain-containing protein [Anaerolineales bacterium]